MTDAVALLVALRETGFSVRVAEGKLLVKPVKDLSAAQLTALARHRQALLDLLGGAPTDAQHTALALRAWDDDPFGDGTDAAEPSALVELEPGRWLAVAARKLALLEQHNKAAREAWARKHYEDEKRKRRPRCVRADLQPPQQPDLFGG